MVILPECGMIYSVIWKLLQYLGGV